MEKIIVSKREQYELFCEANSHQDWYEDKCERLYWFQALWQFELEEGMIYNLSKKYDVVVIDKDIYGDNSIESFNGVSLFIEPADEILK